jgi:hypothetical protein
VNIALERLVTQRLAGGSFRTPAGVVRWFGAVQAQDYPGALWAVGQRTTGATEAAVEQAIASRAIVRTWPLRGTLHFVAPEDVRWMLQHFAPRTIARAAPRFTQLELDRRTLSRSATVVTKALEGGHQLSRPRLYQLLERAGIPVSEGRGLQILWRCAHDGLICFGAREDKQHTFALLDEWVPPAKAMDRDEALAEIARRYFTSHGPATLSDFGWWSGLPAADARSGLEMARPGLQSEQIEGAVYWRAESKSTALLREFRISSHAALLPAYDEYTVAYRDRRAALDPAHAEAARNGIFSLTIVLKGRVAGTWTRQLVNGRVAVALKPFAPLNGASGRAVAAAAERYGRFLGRPVEIR